MLVEQLAVERRRVDPERARGQARDDARLVDLPRIGVDRRRLLADRKRKAGPVEDRPARRRQHDGLPVLLRGKAGQRPRPDALQPRRAAQQGREEEAENDEQEPDPAVDRAPARTRHCYLPPSSTYDVVLAGA